MSNDGHCLPKQEPILLWKTMDKIKHEGQVPLQEISQDADNAKEKVKWFLKVYKIKKLLWEAYFKFSFFQVFIQVHILQIIRFSPPPPHPPPPPPLNMRIKLRN